jgi:hypothetical protein
MSAGAFVSEKATNRSFETWQSQFALLAAKNDVSDGAPKNDKGKRNRGPDRQYGFVHHHTPRSPFDDCDSVEDTAQRFRAIAQYFDQALLQIWRRLTDDLPRDLGNLARGFPDPAPQSSSALASDPQRSGCSDVLGDHEALPPRRPRRPRQSFDADIPCLRGIANRLRPRLRFPIARPAHRNTRSLKCCGDNNLVLEVSACPARRICPHRPRARAARSATIS